MSKEIEESLRKGIKQIWDYGFLSWVALCHGNRGIDYFSFGKKRKIK